MREYDIEDLGFATAIVEVWARYILFVDRSTGPKPIVSIRTSDTPTQLPLSITWLPTVSHWYHRRPSMVLPFSTLGLGLGTEDGRGGGGIQMAVGVRLSVLFCSVEILQSRFLRESTHVPLVSGRDMSVVNVAIHVLVWALRIEILRHCENGGGGGGGGDNHHHRSPTP